MKHILVVYSSRNGQTQKIARYISSRLISADYGVQVVGVDPSATLMNPDPTVDAVIVGAPVYAGEYPKPILKWVRKQAAFLSRRRTAFFSVSLNAADRRPEARKADRELLEKFARETGWQADLTASLAGALSYSHYGFFLKRLMRKISAKAKGPTDISQDYELTDWSQVDAFLASFTGDRDRLARPASRSDDVTHKPSAVTNIPAWAT
jgi:menaquinone-dependent protoporphyrinogen oxidase